MKLFLPSARATNWLLIVGFCALGYALYMRYLAIEQTPVGLACDGGLNTWLCVTRSAVITLHTAGLFGIAAVIVAAINLWRPSLVLFAVALACSALGVVLYNAGMAGFAAGVLVLSLARRAAAPK
jgi:hypothetical protein